MSITADERIKRNHFANFLGIDFLEVTEGRAVAELKLKKDYSNPQGSVHGGVLFTMADSVSGMACAYCKEAIATINCSFNYLKAVRYLQTLRAEAIEIKHGKNIMVIEVSIYDENNDKVASGTFTFANLHKPYSVVDRGIREKIDEK